MKALSFHGSGLEYFKIWIVNILLTVITLGFYYPWAKVRRNRYFYGNTALEDRNFEYHATGKQLFLSYLIALALFIVYVFVSQIFPPLGALFFLALFVLIPWVIVRSMMFNMRMTSFSNVRFSFNKDFLSAYLNFLLFPIAFFIGMIVVIMINAELFALHPIAGVLGIVGLFTFFIFTFAFFKKRHSQFYINNINFGEGKFTSALEIKELMKISLKTMGVGLLLTLGLFIIIGLGVYSTISLETLQSTLSNVQTNSPRSNELVGILIMLVYGGMLLVMVATMAYSFALNRAYIYKNTLLDDKISFASTLQALPFMWVVLSNFFLIIFTLGLAAPWAKVRVAKIVVTNTLVDAPEGFDTYISQAQAQTSALGDQIGDAFDVDIGLGM